MESPSNESEPSESRTFITTGGMEKPKKVERGVEKTGSPKKPESVRSASEGNRREGGRAGAGSSEEREGRERMEVCV